MRAFAKVGSPGNMSLSVPSFLNVNHDEAGRKATLSVLDPQVAHQRAMWGMFSPSPLLEHNSIRTWSLTA
jgi:hypothetical protein